MLFDIGANRGDATLAGLQKGYDVIALEPAPKVYKELVSNFIYNPKVTPLRLAVTRRDNQHIEFYECVEDGLSTTNLDWLTDPSMPYAGKAYRTIKTTTICMDTLINLYGLPDLVKIDVEGAEDEVFAGYTKKAPLVCFEWSEATLEGHVEQLKRLRDVNKYKYFALQYITHHLEEPTEYRLLSEADSLPTWIEETKDAWTNKDWKVAGLRPTADVGMLWVK